MCNSFITAAPAYTESIPEVQMNQLMLLALAANLTLTDAVYQGRAGWALENGLIRVVILRGGGHIAEVRQMMGDARRDVNPMRVPHYPTIDPHTYQDSLHNSVYGDDPHRWLSSGYMGHLLCFPAYGPPSSPDEAAAGLGNHGEAPISEWRKVTGSVEPDRILFRYAADLEKTRYRVERVVTLPASERWVRIEESVENLLPFDRPVQWMQHATFGPPFIEPGKSTLRISAVRGDRGGELPAGESVRERVMPAATPGGSYTALLMDPARNYQFFTMSHPEYPVTIGYVFPTAGNPWAADWQENQRAKQKPWNGKVVARGIEFGSSPYAEGLRKAIERQTLLGTPAYRWIGARQTLRTEFIIFLSEGAVTEATWDGRQVIIRREQIALTSPG
jgi:hypothetical protein